MGKDFKQLLEEKKPIVWEEIQKYLPEEPENSHPYDNVDQYPEECGLHCRLMRDYSERQGKYVRPTLVLLMAEALDVPVERAVKTAAAMQTSQDWILVHDDFMDDSEERRGKPTLHRMYSPEMAVNAADALHVTMWKILGDNYEILGEEKAGRIMDEFHRMLGRTLMGQTVEEKWTQDNRTDLRDEDVFFIMDGKTVYYTIAGPLRLGAILGDATEQQLDDIFKFAIPLGRTFQIRDDILDLTSDFEGLKDQFANDLYEGKRTIMLAHMLRNADDGERERAVEILAKDREEKTREEVEWLLEKIKGYDSIEYGKELAEEMAEQAEEALETELDWIPDGESKEALRSAVDFILTRGK